ncbi:CRIB domain-containing protein RIC5-like isoform X2 [Carex littledalei]|uniref:CRIB domain-containing protein RIC5-like isoform X2 n=1 Tax=Carex littledalei TaxID=544730 RepID=A0A833R141_9POAL|nr:CRIB domain-containing protein RIC5-like isoform X2 [Carex littledalei]
MQIGFPTNVRHVAHIGMDSTDEGPSWMKEYHSAPLPTTVDGSDSPATGTVWASADMALIGGLEDPRSSERSSSASASAGPTREESPYMSPETYPFQHAQSERRNAESSSSRGIAKKGRRYKKKEGVEAPTDSISGKELPAVPKKTRRRKQKDSSETSKTTPVGPSRLKECCTDACAAKEIDKMLQPQVMKPLAISS